MLKLISLLLVVGLCANALAQESKKPILEWCLDELPPRHYFENGIAKGPMVDLMLRLAAEAEFELRFSPPTPPSRCLLKMKTGKTDLMTGLLFSSERAAYIKMFPFGEAKSASAFIRKDTVFPDPNHFIAGATLVLVQDRVYPDEVLKKLNAQARVIYAPTMEAALAILWHGDADILLGPQHITEFEISKNPRYQQAVVLSPKQLEIRERTVSYVGISRASPHADLAEKIQAVLKQMEQQQFPDLYSTPAITQPSGQPSVEPNLEPSLQPTVP